MSRSKSHTVEFGTATLQLIATRKGCKFDLQMKKGVALDAVPMVERETITARIAAHVDRPHEEIYQALWAHVGKAWE